MSLLPAGYKRLLYIESTGTQWIDTGIVPNQDTRVDVTAMRLDSAASSFIPYGAAESYQKNAFECYDSGTQLEFNYDGQYNTAIGTSAVGEVVILSQDKNKISVNGELLHTFTYTSFTAPYTLILFGIHRAISVYGKARIYSCKIYNNGTVLVRNFIPCINDAGEIGLYDAVNGVFCGNSGTGVFIAGPEFRYDELEYIESTGTQRIDTGFYPNQDTRVMMNADVPAVSSGKFPALFFGDSAGTTQTRYGTMIYGGNDGFHDHYGNQVVNTSNIGVSGRHLFDKNKNVTYLDNIPVSNFSYSAFTSAVTLSLFCSYENGKYDYYATFKLYSCKVYDNDTLVRDYIPAKLPDGSIGLIDKMTEEFYPNMGTGVFTAGKIKPTKYMELEYIESTGTQYVDAGFKPNQKTRVTAGFNSKAASTSLFGSQTAWGSASYSFGTNTVSFGSNGNTSISYNDGVYHDVDFDKGVLNVDGAKVLTWSGSFSIPYNLFVLANNEKNTTVYYSSAKLYYCQIYDNDTLVRDYIPIKLYDGTVGLLDKVSGLFYGNAGTGTFVAGPGKAGKYTLLEYIESTGSQYVDTGFKPNQNSRVVLNAMATILSASSASWWYGVRKSSAVDAFGVMTSGETSITTWFGTKSKVTTVPSLLQKITIDQNKTKTAVTYPSGYVEIITNTSETFTSKYNLFLCSINLAGEPATANLSGKIYSCQIYDNGTIVRNFVPIRTEHGIVALYDLTNESVYDNAGTGVFVAGPDAITVPAQPTNLSVQVDGITAILSWTESKDATGYYVYRNGELIATTEATLFTDSIVPSISTKYSVSAFNDFGESDKATISIAPSAAPLAPANLRVMFADFASVQIAWDASVGATAYRVYRDGEFLTETESRIFADSDLSKDTEYVYTVTAINVVGESGASSLMVKTSDFTLITDRTAADVEYAIAQALNPDRNNTEWLKGLKGTYNATDLNRVEKAVEYVANRLEIAGWRRKPAVKIDWSFSDFPTVSEMQRYLDNIRLLRAALPEGMPAVPADMNGFTYIEANTIEQILLLLDAAVTNIMLNIYYSNEKYSGEVK